MRPIPEWLGVLALASTAATGATHECVVLLHGLARTAASMDTMQARLVAAGYSVANIDYPSRELSIQELAPMAVGQGIAECRSNKGVGSIHFVTHSLGGILVRQYLADAEVPELGRVVMLAPPNQGSAAVDALGGVPGFDWINGPAGRQLGKGDASVPLALGPANFELGVVAGTRTIDPVGSAVLDDPDDGKVSVADTRLEGMADFVTVNHSHAYIMRMQRPIDLTIHFLQQGSFDTDAATVEVGP